MKENKVHKFNFRLFSVALLSLMLVIPFLLQVIKTWLLILLFLIVTLVSIVAVIVVNNFKKIKYFGTIMVVLILSVIISSNIFYKRSLVNSYIDLSSSEIFVSGRICSDYRETTTGNILICIDELELVSVKKNVKISGTINIYTNPSNFDLTKIKVGEIITLFNEINFYNFDDLESIKNLSTNCIGYCYTDNTKINFTGTQKLKLNEKVRTFVYSKLKEWDLKHADIAFSMLFGKTYSLDKNIKDIFTGAGVAHFLAVSGLHISLILAIFNYIFSRLKVSKKKSFITILAILMMYMYLCDFSVSVVRASTMSLILSFAQLRHRHYDKMSSMSLTAIIILLFNPLKMYNYSFILSFSTTLTIILIYNLFNNILNNLFTDKFSKSVAICLCVNFGLIFVQLYLFKSFNILSFLANLLIVPLVTVAFGFLLCALPIVFIIKPLSFIFKAFDFLFDIIISLSNLFNNLNLVISTNFLPLSFMILWLAILFLISEYFFTSKKVKLATFISFSMTFLVTYCLLL